MSQVIEVPVTDKVYEKLMKLKDERGYNFVSSIAQELLSNATDEAFWKLEQKQA